MTIIDGLENNAWTQSEVIAALLENKARLEAATNQYIAVTSELREKNRRLEIDLVQNNAAHSELREQNIRYREKIRLQAHVIAQLRHKLEVRDRAEPIRFVPVGSPAMTQTNPGYMVIHCTQCKEETFFVSEGANIKAILRVAGWICTDTERVCKKCLQKGFKYLLPLGCTINGSAKGVAGDGKGNVFVADPDKNRVITYSKPPEPNQLPKEESPTVPPSVLNERALLYSQIPRNKTCIGAAGDTDSNGGACHKLIQEFIAANPGKGVINVHIDGGYVYGEVFETADLKKVLEAPEQSWRDRPSML